jgi:AcrR family transcriptional regulator
LGYNTDRYFKYQSESEVNKAKPTSRDLAQAQTREALLAAARQLVAERGFGGVSVGDVAAAAGFTKGAFYSNFESREAMLLELVQRLHEEQRSAWRRLAAEAPADLAHALEHIVEMSVRHASSSTAALLVGEISLQARRDAEFASRANAGFEQRLNALTSWIDRLVAANRLRPTLTSREIARTIAALTQGLAQQPADQKEIRGIVRAVLRLLFG